jgi:hypothetical protein
MVALTRASRLAGYEDLARSVGVDPRRELQRVGISVRSLEDPDSLISYESFLQLLENTALGGNCPEFGLRLAQSQEITALGPLGVLIGHAATVAEAADFASRFLFVHTPANRITLVPVPLDAAATDITFSIETTDKVPRRQGLELGLAYTARLVRMRSVMVPSARAGRCFPMLVWGQFRRTRPHSAVPSSSTPWVRRCVSRPPIWNARCRSTIRC